MLAARHRGVVGDPGYAAIALHANLTERPGHSIVIAQWGSHEGAKLRRLTQIEQPSGTNRIAV